MRENSYSVSTQKLREMYRQLKRNHMVHSWLIGVLFVSSAVVVFRMIMQGFHARYLVVLAGWAVVVWNDRRLVLQEDEFVNTCCQYGINPKKIFQDDQD